MRRRRGTCHASGQSASGAADSARDVCHGCAMCPTHETRAAQGACGTHDGHYARSGAAERARQPVAKRARSMWQRLRLGHAVALHELQERRRVVFEARMLGRVDDLDALEIELGGAAMASI